MPIITISLNSQSESEALHKELQQEFPLHEGDTIHPVYGEGFILGEWVIDIHTAKQPTLEQRRFLTACGLDFRIV